MQQAFDASKKVAMNTRCKAILEGFEYCRWRYRNSGCGCAHTQAQATDEEVPETHEVDA
jgi:hypothetical protein